MSVWVKEMKKNIIKQLDSKKIIDSQDYFFLYIINDVYCMYVSIYEKSRVNKELLINLYKDGKNGRLIKTIEYIPLNDIIKVINRLEEFALEFKETDFATDGFLDEKIHGDRDVNYSEKGLYRI